MYETKKRTVTALMAVALATAFFMTFAAVPSDSVTPSIITPSQDSVSVAAGGSFTITYSVDSSTYPYIGGYAVKILYDASKVSVAKTGCVDLSGAEFTFNDSNGIIDLTNHSTRTTGKSTSSGLFKISYSIKDGATKDTAVSATCYNVVVMAGLNSIEMSSSVCVSKINDVTNEIGPAETSVAIGGSGATVPEESAGSTNISKAIMSVSSGTMADGGQATITVRLASGPSLGGMEVLMKYDNARFTVSESDVSPVKMTGSTVSVDQSAGAAKVVWHSSNNVDMKGDLFTVTLHAKSGAEAGSSTVSLPEGSTILKTWTGTGIGDIGTVSWSASAGTLTVQSGNVGNVPTDDVGGGSSVAVFAVIIVIMVAGALLAIRVRAS